MLVSNIIRILRRFEKVWERSHTNGLDEHMFILKDVIRNYTYSLINYCKSYIYSVKYI